MDSVRLGFRLSVLLLVVFGRIFSQIHDHYSKTALFHPVQPQDASTSRRVIASFQAPSELSCSQKCLHHEKCNYKIYDSSDKKCELFELISKKDLNEQKTLVKIKRVPDKGLNDETKMNCFLSRRSKTLNCKAKGVYKSCKAALESNGFQTAIYQILPEGFEKPVNVECMKDANGTSFAVVHHNNENETSVKGYEPNASYKYNFTYSLDMSIIIALVNKSVHCQQYTKAICYNVFFYSPSWGWNSFINGRNGQKLDFWGGGPSDGTGCACGITSSCGGAAGNKCNCDANDNLLRSDEGNVIKKEVLPITSINAGDTGGSSEKFLYTIGPLLCVI